MKGYLIDTSICVFALRGKGNIESQLQKAGQENCFLSEITVLELHHGAAYSTDPEKAHRVLSMFIAPFSILSVSNAVLRYAREKVRLRRAGTPIHDDFDLLIGVTAVENGLVLVTDNTRDFKRIADLKMENWMQRT